MNQDKTIKIQYYQNGNLFEVPKATSDVTNIHIPKTFESEKHPLYEKWKKSRSPLSFDDWVQQMNLLLEANEKTQTYLQPSTPNFYTPEEKAAKQKYIDKKVEQEKQAKIDAKNMDLAKRTGPYIVGGTAAAFAAPYLLRSPWVYDLALGITAGNLVDQGFQATTGKDFAHATSDLTGGFISPDITGWFNPGYFSSGLIKKGIAEGISGLSSGYYNYLKPMLTHYYAPKLNRAKNILYRYTPQYAKSVKSKLMDSYADLASRKARFNTNPGSLFDTEFPTEEDAIWAVADVLNGRPYNKVASIARTQKRKIDQIPQGMDLDPSFDILQKLFSMFQKRKLIARDPITQQFRTLNADLIPQKSIDTLGELDRILKQYEIDGFTYEDALNDLSGNHSNFWQSVKNMPDDIQRALTYDIKTPRMQNVYKELKEIVPLEPVYKPVLKNGKWEKTLTGYRIKIRENVMRGASGLDYWDFTPLTNTDAVADLASGQIFNLTDIIPTKLGATNSDILQAITRRNIHYLTSKNGLGLPGVIYGSSTLTTGGIRNAIPHDYEMYITEDMIPEIQKKLKINLDFSSRPTSSHTIKINGRNINLDFNLVTNTPLNGNYNNIQRMWSLYSYLHPDKAAAINERLALGLGENGEFVNKSRNDLFQWMLGELKNNSGVLYTPQTLLQAARDKGRIFTIADNLMSSKAKHNGRLPFILNELSTQDLADGIDLYIKTQSKIGLQKNAQFGVDAFTDVEQNRKLFKAFTKTGNLGDYIDEQKFVTDPQRMKALYDYMMFTNSTVYRGIPKYNKYTNRPWNYDDLLKWVAEDNGGSAHGAGLNMVLGGRSGHGPIVMSMQIPIERGKTPLATWLNREKVLPTDGTPLTNDQKNMLQTLYQKYFSGQIGPQSLPNLIEHTGAGLEYRNLLEDIQKNLGFQYSTSTASVGRNATRVSGNNALYGSGFYVSALPDAKPNETLTLFNPFYDSDVNSFVGSDIGANPLYKLGSIDIQKMLDVNNWKYQNMYPIEDITDAYFSPKFQGVYRKYQLNELEKLQQRLDKLDEKIKTSYFYKLRNL